MWQIDKSVARQRGQAMVEFLVAAMFLLVPLFLAISVIGKFVDVQHTSEMAGRYAAWERTVWYQDAGGAFDGINRPNQKSATAIHNEIAQRMLNNRSSSVTVIKNTDKSALAFANGTDPMWRDAAGVAYLDDYAQMSAAMSYDAPTKDIAGAALSAVGMIRVPGVFDGAVPPLPTNTLAVANVKLAKIAKNSASYQRLWPKADVWQVTWEGLEFKSTGAVLSNTWAANGAGGTKQMVATVVPTAQPLLNGVINTGVVVGIGMWDPTIPARLELGKIAPDLVPPDRLK